MPRFVDYFLIAGIGDDIETPLNPGDIITPTILHITPPEQWEDFGLPPQITNICLPDGWSALSYCPKPIFVTNVLTDAVGFHSYCTSLLYYERSNTQVFVPKVLAVVSRYSYVQNYRDCLVAIFEKLRLATTKSNYHAAENIISQLIYDNYTTEPGSERFIINLGENKSVVYPPLSQTIPPTDDCVAILLKLAGIDNLIRLFGAFLLENKIVFTSKSYTYLYKCTYGLMSLIYPLKYKHIFIPILPKTASDIISVPSPFVIGIHSSFKIDPSQNQYVIIMNLDTGLLICNDSDLIPPMPEPYYSDTEQLLVSIARSDLATIDQVYPEKTPLNNRVLDKKIRACFFYLITRLLAGYRPCTTFSRFVPVPIMRFHTTLFSDRRALQKCDFLNKFFSTTLFDSFISERGPTFRYCDYFDKIINDFGYTSAKLELDTQINKIEKISKSKNENTYKIIKEKVPINIDLFQHDMVFDTCCRLKEMMSECISLIFENQISEALKLIQPVLSCLSSPSQSCKIALINEIIKCGNERITVISSTQLSLLCRLLNFILDKDKSDTCYSCSSLILKLSSHFCMDFARTHQYMYTFLQDHIIWKDLSFWLNFFFFELQSYLLFMYGKSNSVSSSIAHSMNQIDTPKSIVHPGLKDTLVALDVGARIVSEFELLTDEGKAQSQHAESSYIHSKITEVLHKIVYMQMDMESVKNILEKEASKKDSAQPQIANFQEIELFMKKFLQSVDKYVKLKNNMLFSLQEQISSIIESQYELSRKICCFKKETLAVELSAKFKPVLFYENEHPSCSIMGYVFYKKPSSNIEYDQVGSLSLLPARGILYVTNRRLIFMGQPIDPFLSDFVVHISLPVKSVSKFKVIETGLIEFDDHLKYTQIVQIRTKTCFGILFAVSENVPTDIIDQVKKSVKASISDISKNLKSTTRLKNDSNSIPYRVSFSSSNNKETSFSDLDLEKNTLRNIDVAPKTKLNKLTTKAGDMIKRVGQFSTTRKKRMKETISLHKDYTPFNIISDKEAMLRNPNLSEFYRMGVIPDSDKIKPLWRVTTVNRNHAISSTIPEYIMVSLFFQEKLFSPITKMFRQKRIPVCTYVSGLLCHDDKNSPKVIGLFRSESPWRNISLAPPLKSIQTSKNCPELTTMFDGIINTLDVPRSKYLQGGFSFRNLFKDQLNLYNMSKLFSVEVNLWTPTILYIFYDRNFARSASIKGISLVPSDFLTSNDIKKSYELFQRAFFPPAPKEKAKKPFLDIVHESKWLLYISKAISFATSVAFLGDVCVSSSLISFSTGVDLTSVLVSLIQIILDPHYRTFNGFQKLIEKDWLEYHYNFYGKNFVQFSPVFIFFLDCVYQLTFQFPYAFEFNTYYLNFISYHNFTGKFDTFMFGNDSVEQAAEEIIDSNQPDYAQDPDDIAFDKISMSAQSFDFTNSPHSIFKCIQIHTESCTVFHNLFYDNNFKGVIYPQCSVSGIEIWPFYYVHNFQNCCNYHLDMINPENFYNAQSNQLTGLKSKSITSNDQVFISSQTISGPLNGMTYSYIGDGTPFVLDSISSKLYEINCLKNELEQPTSFVNEYLTISQNAYFEDKLLFSSNRLIEFLYYRSLSYRYVEQPKNIKNDAEKPDNSLHVLTKLEHFFPCFCCVCGSCTTGSEGMVYCYKCGRYMHVGCQIYSTMICDSYLQKLNEDSSSRSKESSPSSEYHLMEDSNVIFGKLYTRKGLKNNWFPNFFAFNKKAHSFNVYKDHDINTLPVHSFHSSQLSSCREIKNLPTNIPKELHNTSGAFELKIKKKTELYLTPIKEEAGCWVRTITKYMNG
ncbi:hypothetical protein HZS_486 [Henneguya salminicola]|nr:hypothetical protein HZS_486 [Henneguya salminicola]